jgi:hypothetical protein
MHVLVITFEYFSNGVGTCTYQYVLIRVHDCTYPIRMVNNEPSASIHPKRPGAIRGPLQDDGADDQANQVKIQILNVLFLLFSLCSLCSAR